MIGSPDCAYVVKATDDDLLTGQQRQHYLRVIAFLVGKLGGYVEIDDVMLRHVPDSVVIESYFKPEMLSHVLRIGSQDNRT